MTHSLSIPLLLLRLDIIRRIRRSLPAKLLGKRPSVSTGIVFIVTPALVYIAAAYLTPLLTLHDFGQVAGIGRDLARYHHLILNAAGVFLLYFGLFVGANLIHYPGISENEQLLSYPVVVSDLASYRLIEASSVFLTSCLYFFAPLTILIFLSLGWTTTWVLGMMLLMTTLYAACYFIGINLLLAVASRFRKHGPDRIVIGVVLASLALFVVGVRLFKMGHLSSDSTHLWLWVEHQLSLASLSSPMDGMVLRSWGIGQYLLSLAATAVAVIVLLKASKSSLDKAFHRIHINAVNGVGMGEKRPIRLSYALVNRCCRFLPLEIRRVLTKDILALIRRPNLFIRMLGLLAIILLIAHWKQSSISSPQVFALYLFSTFTVSRLFMNAIGQEQGNIVRIKQLSPSVSRYLSTRIEIAAGVSLLLLLPLWAVLIGASHDLVLFGHPWRLALLVLNLIVTSILVTYYSAAFVEFTWDYQSHIGIHPGAALVFWVIALSVAYLFYRVDLTLLGKAVGTSTVSFLVVSGLLLLAVVTLLGFLGTRRIRQHA